MRIVKISVEVAGRPAVVSLETSFWAALRDIADREAISVGQLIGRIATTRGNAHLSSTLRVFVLKDARQRALQALLKRRTTVH